MLFRSHVRRIRQRRDHRPAPNVSVTTEIHGLIIAAETSGRVLVTANVLLTKQIGVCKPIADIRGSNVAKHETDASEAPDVGPLVAVEVLPFEALRPRPRVELCALSRVPFRQPRFVC